MMTVGTGIVAMVMATGIVVTSVEMVTGIVAMVAGIVVETSVVAIVMIMITVADGDQAILTKL
jgi:hypothetical protein